MCQSLFREWGCGRSNQDKILAFMSLLIVDGERQDLMIKTGNSRCGEEVAVKGWDFK